MPTSRGMPKYVWYQYGQGISMDRSHKSSVW